MREFGVAATRPKGFRLLAAALRTRKSAAMLAFAFSSGLPFALLVGTLTAWLGEVKVNLATIGVLSWVGLPYAFKFLWSPLVDRLELPVIGRIGRRKSWIMLCQALMICALIGLGLTDPTVHIARFALFAFIGAIGSATQDIAGDGWRIDIADEQSPVELLSAIYQMGYRTASIVGGAGALYMAARMSWPTVYLVMAVLMGVMLAITLTAPDTERPPRAVVEVLAEPGEINPRIRIGARARGAAGSRPDAQQRAHCGEPSLRRAGRALGRSNRAAALGRADRDRPDPDLCAVLQYLGVVRVPLLPRFHALFEGRGGLRVEDLRHRHVDHRGQHRRLPLPAHRTLPDRADRCGGADLRQFPLCRSRRWRAAYRYGAAPVPARPARPAHGQRRPHGAAAAEDLLREHQ